jgi:hypothetical protein
MTAELEQSFLGGPMPKGIYPRRVKRHAVTQPLSKSYRIIPLTQGQDAIVDVEDFEWISRWNWNAHWDHHAKCFYARRQQSGKTIMMHREIMHLKIGQLADHKNGNSLDNRKQNLRLATVSQNTANTKNKSENSSGYRGVSRHGKRWRAVVVHHGRYISIGTFATREMAARAYDQIAQKMFGEFAHLNYPQAVNA